jgi:N-sulfoglucosamine sulfohydrolase
MPSENGQSENSPSPAGVARRDFLKRCATGAAAANVVAAGRAHGQSYNGTPPNRPNILYIHSHDTGRYIQPYGDAVPTPALQRMAEQGVLFRQAFSAAPTCSPSRAALLTGQCAHSCGMLGLVNHGFTLAKPEHHIVHTLKKAGYDTAAIGVQHILIKQELAGYDHPIKGGWSAKGVGQSAVQFLSQVQKQPFFLAVGFGETHRGFPQPGPQEDPRYTLPPAPIADTPETRLDMARYKASARVLDTAIADILRTVEESGLAENTLVIYSTDHGISFPQMKVDLRDAGIGVSLLMRGPREFCGGKVIDGMVSYMDIFPTLCDLLEIEHPGWLEGKSMMPLLRGQAQEVNDAVFAEVNYHAVYEPKRCVRTQRWKYIRHYGDWHKPVVSNVDDSPSKDYWVKHGWRDRMVDQEQLYDLVFDPHEAHNVINDPSLRPVADEMRGRLDRWMKTTKDPLLEGPVKAPSGAKLNRPEQLSFTEPRFTVP